MSLIHIKDFTTHLHPEGENRIAPEGYASPGDPGNWEQTKYKKAELSDLGEKILGLKKW